MTVFSEKKVNGWVPRCGWSCHRCGPSFCKYLYWDLNNHQRQYMWISSWSWRKHALCLHWSWMTIDCVQSQRILRINRKQRTQCGNWYHFLDKDGMVFKQDNNFYNFMNLRALFQMVAIVMHRLYDCILYSDSYLSPLVKWITPRSLMLLLCIQYFKLTCCSCVNRDNILSKSMACKKWVTCTF